MPDDTAAPHDESFEKLEDRLESVGILPDANELRGDPEHDIVETLATADRPLADPDRFEHAHRVFVRSIEAISVNGKRSPTRRRRLGPLRPIVVPIVRGVTGWLVDGQTNAVFTDVRRLYELREANSVWNSREHRLLRRARMQLQLIGEDLRGGRLTLPVFLLSGAFLSGALSLLRGLIEPIFESEPLVIGLALVLTVLVVALAAMVLQAASIARMRLRLALTDPLAELYRTIGTTGDPPQDHCFRVALLALVFFAAAMVTVPAGLILLFRL